MWALVRATNTGERVVLGLASAAILLGIVLTVPWVLHGPVQHNLLITLQDLLNGVNIVLVYKLKVDAEDLWKRGWIGDRQRRRYPA